MNWQPIIEALLFALGTVALALVKWAWDKYIKPWLNARGLADAAITVVKAVEAQIGRYQGEQKWLIAIAKMVERGYDPNATSVIDALLAAWKSLDLEQIAAGEKESPIYDVFDDDETVEPVSLDEIIENIDAEAED